MFQAMPQLYQTELWITAAHIPDQLQLRFGMLIWMAARTTGLADQGFYTPIPATPSEVDIRPVLLVLPAGTADAIFLRIFYDRLSVCHVLCYTLSHKGCGLLSVLLSVVTQL